MNKRKKYHIPYFNKVFYSNVVCTFYFGCKFSLFHPDFDCSFAA